jgi:hypothetical protein
MGEKIGTIPEKPLLTDDRLNSYLSPPVAKNCLSVYTLPIRLLWERYMGKVSGVLVVSLVLFSCSPFTKAQYISQYNQFIGNVEKDKDNFTEEQWQQKDKLFNKYSVTYYAKFEKKLTAEEKNILTKYRLEYAVFRYGDKAKKTVLDLLNSYIEMGTDAATATGDALIQQIENYIDNDMKNDADKLIEQGQKLKDTFNRMLNELSTDTESK